MSIQKSLYFGKAGKNPGGDETQRLRRHRTHRSKKNRFIRGKGKNQRLYGVLKHRLEAQEEQETLEELDVNKLYTDILENEESDLL